ncbi:iron-containing redox enzyme family protein [Streptosporangiaceae bacterium NEAU-GS5]|nr:iron-containing redox enzyme family protein [Streptosporangiaceae bacterium NEAU-GS5]
MNGPELPQARGPLSAGVIAALTLGQPPPRVGGADPLGEDLQLALYLCYELHYRGFDGVGDELEWDPDLLRTRGELERLFLAALRGGVAGGDDVTGAMEQLSIEPIEAEGVSHHLRDDGELWQLREYIVHRSIYHLKEGDPHAWVIPRLQSGAKAALVAVEFDEFGGGRAERMHARLFADLMDELGLDSSYGAYLRVAPAEMLAVVNMMSMFGLHRSLRGALVGHFAAAEITSSPGARRMARCLARLGVDPLFYTEHIEADAVHEQVMRRDVIGDLLRREPDLATDVVFGAQATEWLEGRFGELVLDRWRSGRSSLLLQSSGLGNRFPVMP